MRPKRLMLFDVDGTLVLTGGAGLRAMNRACQDLVGHDSALDGIVLAGRTDWIILDDTLRRHGRTLSLDLLSELRQSYLRHLREEIELPGTSVKRALPGVNQLLAALSTRDDVALGLLTGNFADGAKIKLEHFDLWKYFSFGAFGDDSADRNALVPIAVRRARENGVGEVDARDVFVVGDTPFDVACALAVGAVPVGVATGGFKSDQLRDSGAEVVFEDLSNTSAFLELLV
ncbi:MAG TPA: HAD family hydrolase [Vicinamibacterales bacterium]|jgi:phosphoglycolate phosphatase-like HAD superfamily hydrolase|nr:HAD family hydrolase [Vicinamibacterales bacterium]